MLTDGSQVVQHSYADSGVKSITKNKFEDEKKRKMKKEKNLKFATRKLNMSQYKYAHSLLCKVGKIRSSIVLPQQRQLHSITAERLMCWFF